MSNAFIATYCMQGADNTDTNQRLPHLHRKKNEGVDTHYMYTIQLFAATLIVLLPILSKTAPCSVGRPPQVHTMDRPTHIIDPEGEVIIVLSNPNAPFAQLR
jgi:hypothetical protein